MYFLLFLFVAFFTCTLGAWARRKILLSMVAVVGMDHIDAVLFFHRA